MKLKAKIKDIDQREIWSNSSIGTAGIITNRVANIDVIDFKNKIMWYESFVMAFFTGEKESVKSPSGRCCYKFEWVEYVEINGIKINL